MPEKSDEKSKNFSFIFDRLVKGISENLPDNEIIRSYKNSYSIRSALAWSVKKGQPTNLEAVHNLSQHYKSKEYTILMSFLEKESDNFSKAKRIKKVLEKALEKNKISEDLIPAAKLLVKFFDELDRIYEGSAKNRIVDSIIGSKKGASLQKILEIQKSAFEKRKYKKFKSLFEDEKAILKNIQNIASELHSQERVIVGLPPKQVAAKRVVIHTLLGLIAVFLFQFAGEIMPENYADTAHPNEILHLVLDKENESKAENEFEQRWKVNVIGNFTEKDLAEMNNILESYPSDFLKKCRLDRIYFISQDSKIDNTKAEHMKSFIMGKRLILVSGMFNKEIVSHELAHAWHLNYVNPNFKGFEKEWADASQKESHVCEYGKKNIREDIATFVQYIKGREDIKPSENFDGFVLKIKLLYKYGFVNENEASLYIQYLELQKKWNDFYRTGIDFDSLNPEKKQEIYKIIESVKKIEQRITSERAGLRINMSEQQINSIILNIESR